MRQNQNIINFETSASRRLVRTIFHESWAIMDGLSIQFALHTIFAMTFMPGISIFNYVKASECRAIAFKETLQSEKALLNHVIKEYTVETDQMCRIKCYLNPDCVSYNLGPSPTPGMMVCQLNDADRYQYPQDYQDRPGYSYRGIENKCAANPCTSANQTCQAGFTAEGYRCLCPKGFTGKYCEIDIDECSLALHNCSALAICNNKRGSFECVCQVGYQVDGVLCTDVDECSSGLHNCSSNAKCHNNHGSYNCVCRSGFQGDGKTCTDVNECLSGLHNCSVNATCHNNHGSYNCVCRSGFLGDGKTCTDNNECSSGLHNCSVNATCNNTVGSYQCVCLPGFEGNGVTCIENWIKANYSTTEVCFGAANNSFGVFAVPYAGIIKKFKLVYVSGGVAWGGGSYFEGNWGDKATKVFEIHITNIQNERIAPPLGYPLTDTSSLQYELPGQTIMDPQMIFPDFSPFLPVTKGQVFRVWFGEDLVNYSEEDNSGKTCSHVYIVYAKYNM